MSAYHFWSKDCEPCKRMKMTFEALKEDFPEFQWISVNIRDDPEGYTSKFGITTVPALAVHTAFGEQRYSGTDQAMYYRILRNSN